LLLKKYLPFTSSVTLLMTLAISGLGSTTASYAKAPAKRQPLIYAVSNKSKLIESIACDGMAAMANVNGTNVKGTYMTMVRAVGLGHEFGMVSGDVLLTINDKAAESPDRTVALLKEYSGVKTTIKFARKEGNVLVVHDSPAYWVIREADSSTLPSPGSFNVDSYGAVSHAPQPTVTATDLEDFMMQMVNNDRTLNGNLPKLKKSTKLSEMARAYAEDMAKRNFFGHKNPEGLGMVQRGTKFGITNHLAENLASTRYNMELREQVKRCQQNMMNEPPDVPGNHRGNILDPESKSIGVGVAFPKKGGVITVQEFSHDDVP